MAWKVWRCANCGATIGLTGPVSAAWCFCTVTPDMTTPDYMDETSDPRGPPYPQRDPIDGGA